ncbi:hypothetical protein CS022_07415 [Veronia nyctiphanis]|uniref:HTH luxR-type domain-containing protein n=1 Tax=Veronia nyctiphanis TaxID=1278244 RepID=A0A4Q0YRK3_9GAMM|nr:helix-turn-helix transcriptional regulator [Veronia nyctiphanis]RXJ73817.1 hypothetical protein CS022_07415 [Veronia nyctiphanis]
MYDQSELQMHVDTSINQAFKQFGQSVITDRERQVVHFILRGHSAKSIARELGISPSTVQMHRKNLYSKLNISSQSELFNLFIEFLRSHT